MFMCVRELSVSRSECGRFFVDCTCNCQKRYGVPCSYFFKLLIDANIPMHEQISVSMVDVRYLKTFNVHYGNVSEIGCSLYKLQEQCFDFEKFGIPVSKSLLEKLDRTGVLQHKTVSVFESSSLMAHPR